MNRTIGLISTNYTVAGFDELCSTRPAAALPFGGRYRLMDFALSNMVNGRIGTVGFMTPYYYRSILDHMGAGKSWGLDKKQGGLFVLPGSVFGFKDDESRFLIRDMGRNIQYLEQGDGDYVLCSDCSFVYNAVYQALIARHELAGRSVTLLYKELPQGERRRGWYLELDGQGRVTRLERGESGRYLFLNCFMADRSFLLHFLHDYKTAGYMDFPEALSQLLGNVYVASFPFTGYVGYTDGILDYMHSSFDLLRGEVRRELFESPRQINTKIHDNPPAFYAPGAYVRNSVVSSGSIIEGTVENSILFRNVRVEKGAVVRNCIIMENGTVCAGADMNYVICDKNVSISGNVTIGGTAEHPCVLPKGKKI